MPSSPHILTPLEWLATDPPPGDGLAPAKLVYAADVLAERFSHALGPETRHNVKIRQVSKGREMYATLLLEIALQPDGLGLCLAVIPGAGLLRGRLTGQLYALGLPRRYRRFFDQPASRVEALVRKEGPAMIAAARKSLSPDERQLLADKVTFLP